MDNPRDEVRVILALGVVAGILTYFQLRGANIPLLNIAHPIPKASVYPLIVYELNLTAFVFSTYLLLFTLALAADGIVEGNVVYEFLRDLSNVAFLLGSIGLVPIAVNFFLYLEEQATSSNTTGPLSNSATYAGFVLAFVIFLLFLFFVFYKTREGLESSRIENRMGGEISARAS